MSERTPLNEVELSIIKKLSRASFPPATASKRFVRDLSGGYVKNLSGKGRRFLAFVAHKFRRQYALNESEWAWVNEWLSWQAPEEGLPPSLRRLVCKDGEQ